MVALSGRDVAHAFSDTTPVRASQTSATNFAKFGNSFLQTGESVNGEASN